MKHLRTIVDLDLHGCKWPITTSKDGTHLFCNERQRENSSYCPEHHSRAYMGVPQKKPNGRRAYVSR